MRIIPSMTMPMLCAIALAAAASTAFAAEFEPALWLEKRAALTDEAMRLKAAYEECQTKVKEPAQDITIPIENYPNGSVKASVYAAKAQFFATSPYVWGEGVKIRQYTEDGVCAAEIDAANCIVDRKSRSGWADGAAKVTYSKTFVEGADVYFSLAEEYVMILSHTTITSADIKFGGLKL